VSVIAAAIVGSLLFPKEAERAPEPARHEERGRRLAARSREV
jgi:hypothetical protein